MKYTIPYDLSLLDALIHLYPKSSKTTLRSWITDGRVVVDGNVIRRSNAVVLQGQTLIMENRKKLIGNKIPIIYEDSDFVVIDKPSGLLTVATAFEKGETAHALLKSHYHPRRVHVVHRLDQDTSGVMLFALNEKGCEDLKSLFEAHNIERCYTGIVEGYMEQDQGTWTSYLYEDENYVVHTTEDPQRGEKATTHYRATSRTKKYSWLELKLETGKKNQIRVHCQAAGHPVVGDKKYGAHANPIKRLCLHAHLLAFCHPTQKKEYRFESPVPAEFFKLKSKK